MLLLRLQALLDRLWASFWLRPILMILVVTLLVHGLLFLDRLEPLGGQPVLAMAGADGLRSMITLLAGTFISIISVTFSVLIVVFTLANSQFGPRLLDNYLADKGNQAVLGFHVSAFVACLLTLRAITPDSLPVLTASLCLGMAVAGFIVFILHVQHVVMSLKADTLLGLLEDDLRRTIGVRFPDGHDLAAEEAQTRRLEALPQDMERSAAPVAATSSGYVAAIDYDGLQRLATERDLLVVVKVKPGDFVINHTALALVYPRGEVEAPLAQAVADRILLTGQRGSRQDLEFTINKLGEVAIRALSPGINDTYTALACIDRLGSALATLAGRRMDRVARADADGNLRLLAESFTFAGALDAAFNLIRQSGQANPAVLIRLLESLAAVACAARTEQAATALARHADMILRAAERAVPEELDREDVRERHRTVQEMLDRDVNRRGCPAVRPG